MVPDWKTNGKTRTQADSFRDAARIFPYRENGAKHAYTPYSGGIRFVFFALSGRNAQRIRRSAFDHRNGYRGGSVQHRHGDAV